MIKFGSSTRFFVLNGPDDDQEDESKYTYTQLREMRKEELEKRQQQYLDDQEKLRLAAEEAESKGIDWGMGSMLHIVACIAYKYRAFNLRLSKRRNLLRALRVHTYVQCMYIGIGARILNVPT